MPKIVHVMGTRPETIKMAPVLRAACMRPALVNVLCVTGQHRQMLDQVLEFFGMTPDYDLDVMTDGQSLGYVTSSVLKALSDVLDRERPEAVEAGVARLVANDRSKILSSVIELLDDEEVYARMSNAQNSYGKGDAARQIIDYLKRILQRELR